MDRIQQRVIDIALQIPEYVGYQAKERRRDEDKLVRRQLAAKYDEQGIRLARIARQAPLDHVVEIENLDQKLQRLIARLKTAPGGYAGWFDSAQIVEGDLDQLTQFDATLAEGVGKFKSTLESLGAAVKTKSGIEDAVEACADLLDDLNTKFDAREQFVALGKKVTPAPVISKPPVSPLSALEDKPAIPAAFAEFTRLNIRDAISLDGSDYIIAGKITYSAAAGSFWAFLLQDGQLGRWLRVGPGTDVTVCTTVTLTIPSTEQPAIDYSGQSFTRIRNGTATVSVEGASGSKRGRVNFAQYGASGGKQLWVEDFGTEIRTMVGERVDVDQIKAYRR